MPYERLEAWRLCHQLALAVYQITKSWPKFELYGLITQARRAAFSAPVTMAEGSAKRGKREFRRFLDIANGSLAELAYILRLAHDPGYLDSKEWLRAEEVRVRAAQLTWRLYQSMGP
ncbi:MAG: four helix bundle protein [Gemmatimonadales bacterium]